MQVICLDVSETLKGTSLKQIPFANKVGGVNKNSKCKHTRMPVPRTEPAVVIASSTVLRCSSAFARICCRRKLEAEMWSNCNSNTHNNNNNNNNDYYYYNYVQLQPLMTNDC